MLSPLSDSVDASARRLWPADRVERWPLERLNTYANNPRLHSEADLDKIAAAILKWGWTMPALVDENGELLAGCARVAAAAKDGWTSVPVIVAHGWSEEEKRAYRLADNQLAVRASWDPEQLGKELRDLKFAEFDLGLIGFEPNQLEQFLSDLGSNGRTDPDSVPEIPEQPITRAGDVWLLGDHRIGCGDNIAAQSPVPDIGDIAGEQRICLSPIGTIVVEHFALRELAVAEAAARSPGRVVADPVRRIGNH